MAACSGRSLWPWMGWRAGRGRGDLQRHANKDGATAAVDEARCERRGVTCPRLCPIRRLRTPENVLRDGPGRHSIHSHPHFN
eukprot:365267-Chlamydomonas_euryale.AAC.5